MKKLILALLFSSQCFAGGTSTEGGGFFYKGESYDAVRMKRLGYQFIPNPKELPGFKLVLQPFIESMQNKLPVLAAETNQLLSKIWRFVGPEFLNTVNVEEAGTNLDVYVCGVVTQTHFNILRACFNEAKNDKARGHFLLHEIIRAIAKSREYENIDQTMAQETFAHLSMHKIIGAEALKNYLGQVNFGNYQTRDYLQSKGFPKSTYENYYPDTSLEFKGDKYTSMMRCLSYLGYFGNHRLRINERRFLCCNKKSQSLHQYIAQVEDTFDGCRVGSGPQTNLYTIRTNSLEITTKSPDTFEAPNRDALERVWRDVYKLIVD